MPFFKRINQIDNNKRKANKRYAVDSLTYINLHAKFSFMPRYPTTYPKRIFIKSKEEKYILAEIYLVIMPFY